MQIIQTGIEGLVEIIPAVYHDDRGWFYEFYKSDRFIENGITYNFVQENQSFSRKGVVRGLHMQLPPKAQAKLVSVISGKVLDVVVDLRAGSKTFGNVYYCELDANRHNMLMVPEGFAHGFVTLEDHTIFQYKCTNWYNPASEGSILWNDPALKIQWEEQNPILSAKDKTGILLADFVTPFE